MSHRVFDMSHRVFEMSGGPAHELVARLRAADAIGPESARLRQIAYIDTFDWRLFAADMELSLLEDDGKRVLRLETAKRTLEMPLPHGTSVGLVSEIPEGKIRRLLEPVVRVRRLLERVHGQVHEQRFDVPGDKHRPRLRLRMERGAVSPPGDGAPIELPPTCTVEAAAGRSRRRRRARHRLIGELGLTRLHQRRGTLAASVIGLQPGGYRSKPVLDLDPRMRADDAARVIHRALRDTVVVNEPGVRQNLDVEFLHDLRVSVRRARSAIAQIKGVFPDQKVAWLKAELRWLQGVTGPVRDLDVYLLKMDAYRGDLPVAVRKDLDPLETYLRAHHGIEQGRLVAALDSDRYRTLLQRWQSILAPAGSTDAPCPDAGRPVAEVAAQRIWRAYRRARGAGDAITGQSPDEALHALRIECKKLRYLLEFFVSLFRPRRVQRLIADLALLQDALGDFNDLVVQQRQLLSFAHDMVREQQVGADTLIAMGRLVEVLCARQGLERSRFEQRYHGFCGKHTEKCFRRLFRKA